MKGKISAPTLGRDVFIAPGAVVVGDVTLGDESNIWYQSTVRGDDAAITIGSHTNIQDNAVLHVDEGIPLVIGEGCSVGHGAILHGCQIGDNTLIGMGAIVLNGAKIGNNCVIGAGALVTQNREVPDGSLVLGSPGRVTRSLTEEEIQANRKNAQVYVQNSKAHQKGEYGVILGGNEEDAESCTSHDKNG